MRYFDDSKATNPHATLAALQAFDEPVVLIAGGLNKDLDLSVLPARRDRVRAVVAIGDGRGGCRARLRTHRPRGRAGRIDARRRDRGGAARPCR